MVNPVSLNKLSCVVIDNLEKALDVLLLEPPTTLKEDLLINYRKNKIRYVLDRYALEEEYYLQNQHVPNIHKILLDGLE